jgi:hypothetical protein
VRPARCRCALRTRGACDGRITHYSDGTTVLGEETGEVTLSRVRSLCLVVRRIDHRPLLCQGQGIAIGGVQYNRIELEREC